LKPISYFSSLTAEIDSIIHARVRADDPKGYWTYWIADKIARVGFYGGLVVLVSYVVLAKAAATGGAQSDTLATLANSTAQWLVGLLGASVVAGVVRAPLQGRLRERIRTLWHMGADRH
jgi:hypothetical protein